jgi:hypothetical protein
MEEQVDVFENEYEAKIKLSQIRSREQLTRYLKKKVLYSSFI